MRKSSQRGQTLLLFSVIVTVLMGMLGLVFDVGWSFFRKQAAQAAAQAAATAAAAAAVQASGGSVSCGSLSVVCQGETDCPSTAITTSNLDKGCLYATANGFTNGGKLSVKISAGTGTPPGLTNVSPTYWVTVSITERIPQLFSAVFRHPYMSVNARATSGYFPPPVGGCIYTLNSYQDSLVLNGNTVFRTGCGININSDSTSALRLVGGASVTGTSPDAKFTIVGNYSLGTNSTITPTPITNAPHFSDPMRDVPPPNPSTCNFSGVSIGNNQTLTIDPGTYCGGITVTGHAALTLRPGLYILNDSGLSVGGQASISGTGVTLYYKVGTVSFAGGATTNLSAPTSGAWQGVLMYQDRVDTSSASLVGGSGQILSGVLYFPNTHVDYTGGSSTSAQNITIIADTLNIVGNSYITATGSSPFLTLFSGIGVLE